MAKKQQQKTKERERRVAKKKLAAAAKRRAQEKTTKDSQKSIPERTKVMAAAIPPKVDYVPTSKKSPFTQRRGGS